MICLNLDNIFNWIELNAYHNLVKSKVVKGNPNLGFKTLNFLCSTYVNKQGEYYSATIQFNKTYTRTLHIQLVLWQCDDTNTYW